MDHGQTTGAQAYLCITVSHVNPVPTDSKSEFGATDAGGSLLVLALPAPIAGAGAGLVGELFRLALQRADDLRNAARLLALNRLTPT